MAMPTCVKCGSYSFEKKEGTLKSSDSVICFVQCCKCGSVVGVMDPHDIGAELQLIKKKLGIL